MHESSLSYKNIYALINTIFCYEKRICNFGFSRTVSLHYEFVDWCFSIIYIFVRYLYICSMNDIEHFLFISIVNYIYIYIYIGCLKRDRTQ